MSLATPRDTDADWQRLGQTDPFWAIVTQDQYRAAHFDDAARARFYQSGVGDIDWIHNGLKDAFNVPDRFASALDFGCGAGRLLLAMSDRCSHVAGVDVAQSMRALCEAALKDRLHTSLPSSASVHETIAQAHAHCGPFQWVNSYIVLQHIPPVRGLVLIEQLLAALAPGGYASLHLTAHRDPALQPKPNGARGLVRTLLSPARNMLRLSSASNIGQISMFDYDMSAVLARFTAASCDRLTLIHTDHGGHHGYMIFSRKGAP
jgi:SAM-dependent methyltransferase